MDSRWCSTVSLEPQQIPGHCNTKIPRSKGRCFFWKAYRWQPSRPTEHTGANGGNWIWNCERSLPSASTKCVVLYLHNCARNDNRSQPCTAVKWVPADLLDPRGNLDIDKSYLQLFILLLLETSHLPRFPCGKPRISVFPLLNSTPSSEAKVELEEGTFIVPRFLHPLNEFLPRFSNGGKWRLSGSNLCSSSPKAPSPLLMVHNPRLSRMILSSYCHWTYHSSPNEPFRLLDGSTCNYAQQCISTQRV